MASMLLFVGLPACGGGQKQVVQLDPIVIKHQTTPAGRRVYVRDFTMLYDEGIAHYGDKRWRDAAEVLEIAVKEYPRHAQLGPAFYHAGLARLVLSNHDRAAAHFRQAIRHYNGTRDARDALFLLAEALNGAGRHGEAAAVYKSALNDPAVHKTMGGKLGVLDRLEAITRRGIALRRAGDVHKADHQLRAVERLYRNHRDIRPVAESDWIARAYFERGEIYRDLFASIRFKLPVKNMARDLEDKSNLFLKAQSAYFRGVRLHNDRWSLAAGFQIGNLYAQLIDDIYAAEVPAELSKDLVTIYREELWKHTGKLAKKAIVVFRKNIDLARRMGRNDEWVRRSQSQLDRMQELIRAETERERRGKMLEAQTPQAGTDPARIKPYSGK